MRRCGFYSLEFHIVDIMIVFNYYLIAFDLKEKTKNNNYSPLMIITYRKLLLYQTKKIVEQEVFVYYN